MYSMEFMILYLAEVAITFLGVAVALTLIRLFLCIGRLIWFLFENWFFWRE